MAGITITLAGQDYAVGELRLRALRDIHAAALSRGEPDDLQEDVRRFYDRTVAVVAAALAQTHPELTLEALLDLPITRPELVAANNRILELAGLVSAGGDDPAGEAGTGRASTGN